MATTPQPEPLLDPLPPDVKPKLSFEEFQALVRAIHKGMMEHDPDYDLDAELEAEHHAILNGADL